MTILGRDALFVKREIPPDLLRFFEPAECGTCYVCKLVVIFREVRRVLREDGVVFLVLGDSYATGAGKVGECPGGGAQGEAWAGATSSPNRMTLTGLKPGDLVGIPWRVSFALQADGWWLRSATIWAKRAPMPESVSGWSWQRHRDCPGCARCSPNGGYVLRRGSWRPTSSHEYVFLLTKSATYFGDGEAVKEGEFLGRNLRDVWTLGPEPFSGPHFAVFPTEIPRRCIKAGTSAKGVCPACGAPWVRVVERRAMEIARTDRGDEAGNRTYSSGTMVEPPECRTLGWRPSCSCIADACEVRAGADATAGDALDLGYRVGDIGRAHAPIPATVLDPFSGAGTTGVVCVELGRNYIGIELNHEYAEMSRARIAEAEAPSAVVTVDSEQRTVRQAALFTEASAAEVES